MSPGPRNINEKLRLGLKPFNNDFESGNLFKSLIISLLYTFCICLMHCISTSLV